LWAHNPEVTGSTPVAGILTLRWLCRSHYYTSVALHGTDVWLNDAKESGYGPGLNPFFIQLDSGRFMNLHSVGFCKPHWPGRLQAREGLAVRRTPFRFNHNHIACACTDALMHVHEIIKKGKTDSGKGKRW
jgi:hypothetical protein